MNTSAVVPHVGTIESVMELGQYVDRNAGAVTFCFGVASFADKAHREELLGVEHLVDGAKADSSGVRKNLAKIRDMAEEIRTTPGAFRAVFAGSDGGVWREFSLPVSSSASLLEVGARFRIVSLLRALEACTPYVVVFVERGKARIFKVRGTEIVEFDGPIPSEDLTLYNDDPRVGWSHHIDKNVEERTKAYLRELAGYLKEFMRVAHFAHLVVGCRGDVWSEFEPELARAGIGALVAGQFHLPYFAITPSEALKAAAPAFKKWQEQGYEGFWKEISDHRLRGVMGVPGVLEGLEAGRVQRLFLGKACDDALFECLDCGKWQFEGGACLSCGAAGVVPTTAGEVLVRLAFRSGAEILAPSDETPYAPDAVGALLRY